MTHDEQVEKIRQAIMRYRELLDVLHNRAQSGERGYASLFDLLPQEQQAALPEKMLQREAALLALADMEPLRRAVLRARFDMRDMERAFEELYNNIAPEA
jgi:ADP-ribose pyrophosphatase YjhB (NUDIX family)